MKASVRPVTFSEKVESEVILIRSVVICNETVDGSDSSENAPVPIGFDVDGLG